MTERKPVEQHVIKYSRDPHELDADISDMTSLPCPESSLPLEHQLLETLRALDLDNDRAGAIAIISCAFDNVEIRGLANGLGYIMRQIKDKADAECLSWLLNGKVETLRELANRVGMSAPGVFKRIKRLEASLRGILQEKTSSTS